jgi:hypothetical protein
MENDEKKEQYKTVQTVTTNRDPKITQNKNL